MSEPAFEIITDTHHIKIFKEGRVEGIDPNSTSRLIIINRIPQIEARAAMAPENFV